MSNISSEFKEIITIISDLTMKPIEKMNQLIHLQEIDNIKYNLKQIFKTKDIIRSSASLASFSIWASVRGSFKISLWDHLSISALDMSHAFDVLVSLNLQ